MASTVGKGDADTLMASVSSQTFHSHCSTMKSGAFTSERPFEMGPSCRPSLSSNPKPAGVALLYLRDRTTQ